MGLIFWRPWYMEYRTLQEELAAWRPPYIFLMKTRKKTCGFNYDVVVHCWPKIGMPKEKMAEILSQKK